MSHYNSSMDEIHQEMQLLSFTTPPHYVTPPQRVWPRASSARLNHFDGPSLDLQLSISVTPLKPPKNVSDNNNCFLDIGDCMNSFPNDSIETLKWQAAEQIRMAAMERAYAERLMEMTRREMELAHSLWTRAREEADKVEKMKERAFRISADSMCMEITCLCCRNKFRH